MAVFITFPQWLAGTWSLFSSTPLFVRLKSMGLTMPQFSLYWVTIPLGLVFIAYIALQSFFHKRNELRKMFTAMVDGLKAEKPAASGDMAKDYYRSLQPINPIGELIKNSNAIRSERELNWLCEEFERLEYAPPLKDFKPVLGSSFRWLPVLREARHKPQEIKTPVQFLDFLATSWSEKEVWKKATEARNSAPVKVEPELFIHSAKWGIADTRWDVAKIIRSYLIEAKTEMVCEPAVLGEPCPGIAKILTIDYSFSGKRMRKIFKERDLISPQDLKRMTDEQ